MIDINGLYLLLLTIVLAAIIITVFGVVNYVNGEVITPYNTGNSNIVVDQSPYCSFGERDNCQSIPQDVKIPKEHIWHIGEQ